MQKIVDIHSHILPGLDDGAQDVQESLHIASEAARNGVTDMIATPHFAGPYMIYDRGELENYVSTINDLIEKEGIDLKIHTGAEVFCSPKIIDLHKQGRLITLAGSNYVLMDMPFDSIPFFFRDLIFQMSLSGLIVVLAHAERNMALQHDPRPIDDFIRQGALLQINTTSITGYLGSKSQKLARRLIKERKASVIASDAHSADGRGPNFDEAYKLVEQLSDTGYAEELMREMPQKIIQ